MPEGACDCHVHIVGPLAKYPMDPDRVYTTEELASGSLIMFSATGVTDGSLLKGVRFFGGGARTHSLVMGLQSRTIRFVDTVHVFDPQALGQIRL